ncbi:MAG: formylglycine-generating enzyme family protein [Bacteroidales bacterium]|nr:formylglycine-generating enzyme family protein [Bacteroidales bacterium]
MLITTYSQEIKNVYARLKDQSVIITYDLIYSDNNKDFYIELYITTDNGNNFTKINENIEGEAGKNIKQGTGKKIIWYPFKNNSNYNVKNAQFKVKIPQFIAEMIFVKGGTYQMGSNKNNDEKPVHTVTVSDFYIGKYEVTQKQWKEIMGASTSLSNSSRFKGVHLPVEKVSWNDIQLFLQKLNTKIGENYRLPTEAEWEYAAKGGIETPGYASYKYSGSNNPDDVAWYSKNSSSKTHKIGTKQANELGIYDMSGNVWEWCSDWYDNDYYSSSPENNPQGASSGSFRVRRGGSWVGDSDGVRCASRGGGHTRQLKA